MNKEIANKWAAALRSGDYPQGTGRLYDGKAFCCLGVLVEQFRIEFPGIIQREDAENMSVYQLKKVNKATNYTGVLPGIVSTWAGMASVTGVFRGGFGYGKFNPAPVLVGLSDDDGLPLQPNSRSHR